MMTGNYLFQAIDRIENHGYKYCGRIGNCYQFVNRYNSNDWLYVKNLLSFVKAKRW